MEDLLFPAVVATAVRLQGTAIFVTADEVSRLPLLADFKRVVGEVVRLSAEVLPVVRVHTLGLVVLLIVRAPLSFEVVHVEVIISVHLVDQRSLDVGVTVGKRAVLLILAFNLSLGAKFCLVALDMVQTLHFVMSKLTILILAILGLAEVHRIGHNGRTTPSV